MKSKKSSLRAALFLALIGAAFAFTACWQGTPAGGDKLPDVTENGGKTSDGDKSGDTDSKDNNSKDSGGKNSRGGNTASRIEGITWKSETAASTITLRLKSGHVKATLTAGGHTVPDNGTYTVSGDTIQFTGFTLATYLNREFKYKVENGTFEMWTEGLTYKFKKA